jgi:spore coat polysaccharide biosynthesis protein SpsF
MKILAIVQARTKSQRLPLKVLKEIAGKPMLWHVINRVRRCSYINDIVLAIPKDADNDILEDFAQEIGVKCFRGSESNVLSRYYGAALKYPADVIVRITSDCPLIDPEITDLTIKKFLDSKVDYVYADTRSGFPRGLDTEVCSFKVLERAFKESTKYYEKEHVTPYIYQSGLFTMKSVEAAGNLRCGYRLCVDTEEDLELVRKIYQYLYIGKVFGICDVIDLLEKYPELLKINAEIKQKALH